jgi:hypothetical protein
MKHVLMHKDIEVLDLDFAKGGFFSFKLGKIHSQEHVPLGAFGSEDSEYTKMVGLADWWSKRLIPSNRPNLRRVLSELGVVDASNLAMKTFGLSLTDHYWVKPSDSGISWFDVNFYDNPFEDESNDVFLMTTGGFRFKSSGEDVTIRTPDATTGGTLIKKWAYFDGIPCLWKSSAYRWYQETGNEEIDSLVLDRLGIPHVTYALKFYDEKPMSVCPCFVTRDTELVTASWMMRHIKSPEEQDPYRRFLHSAERFGLPDQKAWSHDLIAFDFLIGNTDRHTNNFEMIRNADTLAVLGFAPIFDNGFCLWHDIDRTEDIRISADIRCFPFRDWHSEQIKLVSELSHFDLASLEGIEQEFVRILNFLDFSAERTERICQGFKYRISLLQQAMDSSK